MVTERETMTQPIQPTETPVGSTPEGGGTGHAKPEPRKKGLHIGAPQCFLLEQFCQDLNRAFSVDGEGWQGGCYVVGSVLERPDWRDVDVRFIMEDKDFDALFPNAGGSDHNQWEFDPRWILMSVSISERMSRHTGLPIDFQFQPQTHANRHHKGRRNAVGIIFKG